MPKDELCEDEVGSVNRTHPPPTRMLTMWEVPPLFSTTDELFANLPDQVMNISIIFCPIWFLANYCFNEALSLTSVSSNTILSSTSSLFTLLIGAAVRCAQSDTDVEIETVYV